MPTFLLRGIESARDVSKHCMHVYMYFHHAFANNITGYTYAENLNHHTCKLHGCKWQLQFKVAVYICTHSVYSYLAMHGGMQ